MKKILLASVALVLAACGGSASYEGTYEGTFPCAQNKVLTLVSEKESGKTQQYLVKEDGSIAFLEEGKEVTGELASYYILKKK